MDRLPSKQKLIRRKPFFVYPWLACALACFAAIIASAAAAWTMSAMRAIALLAAAASGLVAALSLLLFFKARLPLVLSGETVTIRGLWRTVELSLPRVIEARWSVALRSPSVYLRTGNASARIAFAQYPNLEQLQLVRFLRKHLPGRAHHDWYRFCRYALYVRRRVMIEARDERTPAQRRRETIAKWIGVMAGAALLGMASEDAGRAYVNAEMAEEIARNGIPHEALSDTEWNERWFELGAWLATIVSVGLLCWLPWVADGWRACAVAVAALLAAVAIFAWRKQSRIEEEIALETAADTQARWEVGESR